MSSGFDDLDDVMDDEGKVKDISEQEPDADASREGSRGSSSSDAQSENGEPSVGEAPAAGEETDTSAADTSTDEPESVEPSIRVEATPDSELVAELSSHSIPGTGPAPNGYPYAIRRGGWDDERSGNLKFVMRPETKDMEEAATEELKEELFSNTDLNITDLREAAYIVGLQNFDDVVDVLNQWGFAEQEDMLR